MIKPIFSRLYLLIYLNNISIKLIIIMPDPEAMEELSPLVVAAVQAAKSSPIGKRLLRGLKAGGESFVSSFLAAFNNNSTDATKPTDPPV
jgi:hypothetical protein